MTQAEEDHRKDILLRQCLEIIEQTYKGKPCGVPENAILKHHLYVLDWKQGQEGGITVEWVEDITTVSYVGVETKIVHARGGITDLATYASIVVGGPFKY